jgi:hypothetical protein
LLLTPQMTLALGNSQQYSDFNGPNERPWKLKYVAQDGKAKNLALRLQWASNRGGNGYGALDQDTDEYRVIVDYPRNVF